MITFDFPPLTSEMSAWNDSHKSTVSDVCVCVPTAGVVTLEWEEREGGKTLEKHTHKKRMGRNKKRCTIYF